jgi:hypothetical protein
MERTHATPAQRPVFGRECRLHFDAVAVGADEVLRHSEGPTLNFGDDGSGVSESFSLSATGVSHSDVNDEGDKFGSGDTRSFTTSASSLSCRAPITTSAWSGRNSEIRDLRVETHSRLGVERVDALNLIGF